MGANIMAFDPTTAHLVSDEFDPTTAKPVSGGATGEWEPDTEMSLSSETATRVPKIPGVDFVAEAITTPLDLIDMGVGVFGLTAKTIEQGELVLYEHGKAAMQGETIDPEAMKNISGFMAEQSAKPEYAASLAPIRTAFEQAGTPLSETPITRVFGGITEAIEKGSEAAGEYTGTEAVKYGGPMVSEGLMALFAAHGINKAQAKKTVNTIRAEKIKEAQAAGLTTNEMAETILKKAAKEGIKVPEEMKGQIKVTLDQLAEGQGTTVDYTGASAKASVERMAKLNEAMAPFDRRQAPRLEPSLIQGKYTEAATVGLVPKLEAVHYSQAERPVLSGKFYGTGAKGAERTRLAQATDPRIKSRVAFYVNEGQGVFPEQGVGRYAHEVQLDNLYDAAKNPLKLPAEPNAFESAVIDAGFDGYYVKGAFGRQGAAVVLGDAAKEIKVPKKIEPVFNLEAQKEWIETRTREIPKERAIAEAEVIISLPEGLQKAAKQMIERSQRGLRGGLVIDAAENLNTRYAEKLTKFSGKTKEDELRWIERKMPQIPGAEIGGFYDPNTGVVFLNASSKRAATDRLLHEISHASDNPKLNAEIMDRLAGGVADESGLYARVRTRMENANARMNPTEATAYLVSEVMAMGRQAGFSRLDTGFWQWATKALPPETLNWIKNIVAQVRATLYKYGAALKESDLTPDDIVALTKSNMKDIAKGTIETASFQDSGLNIKIPNKISSAELYKEVVDEGKKKIIDAERKGLKDFTPEELPKLLEKNNWAIITAENPKGRQLTPAKNTHRMAAMRAELKAAGITFHEAEGVFNATKENSLVLTNVTKQQALEIAQRWEQEAAITKDGLLYTDGSVRPATGLSTYSERPTALTDHTYIPETGTSFNIKVGERKQGTTITTQAEAEFARQRQGQPHKITPEETHKAQQAELDSILVGAVSEPLTKVMTGETGKARGQAFKQRGAIGYLYVPTLEDAIKLASQREGMVGKQVERGWRVEVPMSLEEAAKLQPDDVINWSRSPEDYAKLDYFKKQRGAIGDLYSKKEVLHKVEIVTMPNADRVKVFINPSKEQIQTLFGKNEASSVRTVEDGAGNLYMWSAYDATHWDIAKHYGVLAEEGAEFTTIKEALAKAKELAELRAEPKEIYWPNSKLPYSNKLKTKEQIAELDKIAKELHGPEASYLNQHGEINPIDQTEGVTELYIKRHPIKVPLKQRGQIDSKLLITSGIVLGGATLGAVLSPDLETTQGLLLGTAIGFGLTRLPQATRAISHNWKNAIKTTAIGTTYATVGAMVDEENPVEGILVGSVLFGTRFLPKTKAHPEDDLINARNGNIAAEKRLKSMITKAMRDEVPDKANREYIYEHLEDPKFIGRNKGEQLVVEAWRGAADAYHQLATNEGLELGFIENYVTRIVENKGIPQSDVTRVMASLLGSRQQGSARTKFTKARALKYTPEQVAAAIKEARKEMITARKEGAQQLRTYIKDNKENLAPYEIAQMWQEHKDTFSKAARDTYLNAKLGELKAKKLYPTIESLEKALEGTDLRLKTKDIAEVADIYYEAMTRTIENQKLINGLKRAIDSEGRPANWLTTERQYGYVQLSNPQLLPYYVHPDVAPALKFVFDSRNHGDIINGLVSVNRVVKRINVFGSFFHAKSLLEAYALAGGNLFTFKKVAKEVIKQYHEAGLGSEVDLLIREGGLRVEIAEDISVGALQQVGQLADAYVEKVTGHKMGGGEKVLGGLENFQKETFDKVTWGYIHPAVKLGTALRLMEEYKLGKKGKGIPEDVYRKGVASHVNDTFGGLDWYKVVTEAKTEAGRKLLMWGLKPSARDYLGVALFAPDWTLSTVRAVTKALPGGAKNPANALLARQYVLRTAALYAGFMVPLNYVLSGHFPWEDEQKDPTRIDLGDGRTLQAVKHSMEFAEWVRDPWKTFSNKMGAFPRTFTALQYGKQYPKGPDIEGSRMGYVTSQFAPFTARAFQGDTEPESSAKRALLGMLSLSIYGTSEEEKEYAKEQRQLRKEQEEEEE
jgi:hypothetical protein